VLGVTFSAASTAPLFAFGVLGLFALGHCAVIAAAGASSHWVQCWLTWQGDHPGAVWLRRICGLLVIAGGVWLVVATR
jgi:cytochrome c-type biogenesis protein